MKLIAAVSNHQQPGEPVYAYIFLASDHACHYTGVGENKGNHGCEPPRVSLSCPPSAGDYPSGTPWSCGITYTVSTSAQHVVVVDKTRFSNGPRPLAETGKIYINTRR